MVVPRWVWPCVLGWVGLVGAGPWVLRGAWTGPDGGPVMEYVACVAVSAFVVGVALGRVRAWVPAMAAGGLCVLAVPVTSGAFVGPVGEFGDEAVFLFGVLLMLGLVVQLPLLIGLCFGSLVGSLAESG
ncbi:hypothetical protein [Kitasatospora terrestris]|uniref:Uncharacterized protein n=1 Tax=Kitasatospora terrestris TaxID=258051 RepID=A0ABP9DH72_9ACTN